MKQSSLFFPLFLIIVGALWFLRTMDWLPATSTIIACILVATGLLVLLLDGINKQSIVSAPLLMYIGGAIYLCEQEGYGLSPIIAMGMIFSGCLLLLARSDLVPAKRSKHLPRS